MIRSVLRAPDLGAVLAPHQAARGVAHRLHRGDRHAARRAARCRRWAASSAATLGIALVAGAAAAFNCLVEQKIDAVMARTRGRPTVIGHDLAAADPAAVRRGRRPGPRDPLARGESAHHVAHARHVRRLRGHLHGDPQAGHAAEHRDRRRLGRDAAGAGLGGDDRRRDRSSRCCSSSSSSRGRRRTSGRSRSIAARSTRKRRRADAAGDARRGVHAPAPAALHAAPHRGDAAAVRDRHGGRVLPRRARWCWTPSSSPTRSRIWRRYSDALARRTFALFDLLPRDAVRGADGGPLPAAASRDEARRASRRCSLASHWRSPACDKLGGARRRSRASTSPAPTIGARAHARRSGRQAAHARGFPRQGAWW